MLDLVKVTAQFCTGLAGSTFNNSEIPEWAGTV